MAYTSENTNMTMSGGLTPGMQTYYNRELLRTFEPNLVHDQFAEEHPHTAFGLQCRKKSISRLQRIDGNHCTASSD